MRVRNVYTTFTRFRLIDIAGRFIIPRFGFLQRNPTTVQAQLEITFLHFNIYHNSHSRSMDDFYKRREECTKAAMESGITNALKSLVVAVPIVAFLSTRSHFVKHSVSTKTALIVSPFFFSFFLSSELEMNRCKRRQAGMSS